MNLTCSITAAWCQWPFKDRRFKTKINDIFLTACEQINEWSIYKNKVICILTLQSQDTLNKGPGVSVKRMSKHPQRNIPEACIPFTHITLPIIRSRHNSPMPEFPQQPSLGSGYRLTCRAVQKVTPPVLPIQIQARPLLPMVMRRWKPSVISPQRS